jgi:hypothetical protein
MSLKRILHLWLAVVGLMGASSPTIAAPANEKKPNILVIWGDDIGMWNISHNNRGMMAYKTPSIDSIAKEGVVSVTSSI